MTALEVWNFSGGRASSGDGTSKSESGGGSYSSNVDLVNNSTAVTAYGGRNRESYLSIGPVAEFLEKTNREWKEKSDASTQNLSLNPILGHNNDSKETTAKSLSIKLLPFNLFEGVNVEVVEAFLNAAEARYSESNRAAYWAVPPSKDMDGGLSRSDDSSSSNQVQNLESIRLTAKRNVERLR